MEWIGENESGRRLLSYQAANLQGIGTRPRQEDSFAFVNAMDVTRMKQKGLLAVLADGMGGMQDGKRVSETAVAGMIEEFSRMDRESGLAEQLKGSVYRINDRLCAVFGGTGGTTLAVCIIFREKLYFASVGDSYIYLKRGGGIYRINREHTRRQELYLQTIAEGRLDPAWAETDEEADSLQEFLGKDGLGEVDYFRSPLPLRDGDILLLCSDGVGKVLTERELQDCLEEGGPKQALCSIEREIQWKGRRHQDNYTALMIACGY